MMDPGGLGFRVEDEVQEHGGSELVSWSQHKKEERRLGLPEEADNQISCFCLILSNQFSPK